MTPFRRRRDGRVSASFQPAEAQLLLSLAEEAVELARAAAATENGETDPALRRLLPDAYPDDPEASAEFRRFTAAGLADRKERNARVLMDSLAAPSDHAVRVVLDEDQASAWLRTITDVRLVLASRLGIHEDGDEGHIHDEESAMQRAVYDWLAGVQELLVLALRP
ncbi:MULTISPECIES: DUF2017 domain-containing protein [unclassified Leifsonia]|uniref:DUF2017 domain-containing protein n=1 Tax=unclassified Leifsonia TaxID=2663824 RepID=UPI0008A73FAB|nr:MULTISPECIES: DUF2017 domain-containing protein [unclassified Leifsonia]SEI16161.1 protein of unknown function [Leifsonia sp. CL154]SFM05946.1 protein of unknown function [Leifsonia sp. CL147]